jgi:glycosyltransferase involved in cell wall biosynthesis
MNHRGLSTEYHRADQPRGLASPRLRIAMLAPPWIPVPPPGYGGIEAVVDMLTRELVRRGHRVTLFAAPGSRSPAELVEVLDRPHPNDIERALYEVDHVARVFAAVDRAAATGRPYDVLHDHCGFTAVAMADRLSVPVVHTLHGPFTADTAAFYAHHAGKAHLVAISHAQLEQAPGGLPVAGVVPNPIDAAQWPLVCEKDDYLLWVGRMTAEKGPHRAIVAARLAGMPLVLAGPVQAGQERFFEHEVAPHIDGRQIRYVGEVGGREKTRLFSRARALLMPIRWPEPFGMVMLEAMVCGTPAIAFAEGAARELVRPGQTGFLVDDEQAMAEACAHTEEIDPRRCRGAVVERCDVSAVAAAYEAVYRRVVAEPAGALGARRAARNFALTGVSIPPAGHNGPDPRDDGRAGRVEPRGGAHAAVRRPSPVGEPHRGGVRGGRTRRADRADGRTADPGRGAGGAAGDQGRRRVSVRASGRRHPRPGGGR